MAIDNQAAERVRILYQDLAPLSPAPTLADLRQAVDAMYAKIPLPEDIEVEEADADGVRALWVRAPGTSLERVVLHFHGGAYIANSPGNYREYGYRLSQAADARVLLGSYRQAPEHPYPAAVEDCHKVFRWAVKQADPARLAVSGDSAGSALALAVSILQRDAGDPLPAALALVSPYINLDADTESYTTNAQVDVTATREAILGLAQVYLNGRKAKETPLASPLYADLSGLPPMYVAVGGHELLLDDSKLLVAKARATDVEAELEIAAEMQHVYTAYACILPEARATFAQIGRFIKDRTRL
jgi:monoterpene epsilon-lactone hydrolase